MHVTVDMLRVWSLIHYILLAVNHVIGYIETLYQSVDIINRQQGVMN